MQRRRIKKSSRGILQELHPDLNPGNAKSASEFKAVSAANDLPAFPRRRGV